MTAKAFNLNDSALLRIPSSVYASLEQSFANRLKTLYKHVGAPTVASWRKEHTSIYFIVAQPVSGSLDDARSGLKDALGAQHCKTAAPGSPISILAVPIAGGQGNFHKIEVHECHSEAEFHCAQFYLSYGDLGMIMSLMARVHGFVLGSKGLKTRYAQPDDTRISGYLLSSTPEKIIKFYGLSTDTWTRGFKSQDEVFAWIKTSRLYNAKQLVGADALNVKKSDPVLREMYHAFISLASKDKQQNEAPNIDSFREDALVEFGKKENYEEQVRKNRLDRARREKYNGLKVMEWTKQSGIIIRDIMNKVREQIGEKGLIEYSEEILRNKTLLVANEIKPRVKNSKDKVKNTQK